MFLKTSLTCASKHVIRCFSNSCSCCPLLNSLPIVCYCGIKYSPKLFKSVLIAPGFKSSTDRYQYYVDDKNADCKTNGVNTLDEKCIKELNLNIEEEEKLKEKKKTSPVSILKAISPSFVQKKSEEKNEKSNETVVKKAEKIKSTKLRKPIDFEATSLDRNFITPLRAMTDFLLKPSDLESLPKTKRRSPYENEPDITVYWRKDVEAKAMVIWGTRENLNRELFKRDIDVKRYQQNIFTVKQRMKDYRRELKGDNIDKKIKEEGGLMGRSGKVVLTAVAINASNCLFKFIAWLYTGSHSMFSECIHSLADTVNQLILVYGINKSVQTADPLHPYGYTKMKSVSSLISGVGIFCVGSGLSIYHGVVGIIDPTPIEDFYWAYFILAGSLVSEGATLLVALSSLKKGAREKNVSLKEYIFSSEDPSVNVVLMEDSAAVLGVAVAAVCMGWSTYIHSPIPDAVGSLAIGGLLASVASFIIYTNVTALVGKSIDEDRLAQINAELESDVMVRAIHDVKGIDMGNSLVRYKAEIDFDGKELTRFYLDKQDLNVLLEEINKIDNIDQVEEFMLKHGENIVDMLGAEIDRIERKLRKKHPEIRHVDLELL